MGKLTEEETKARNANKTKNLINQADHLRCSSNINSIGCIERYEDAEYRLCKLEFKSAFVILLYCHNKSFST